MNDSTFNPEVFLNTTYDQPNATELKQIPEGEYTAISGPITAGSLRSYDIKRGQRAGERGYSLDIEWTLNDEDGRIKEIIGREPKVRQGIMLDIKKDGTLELGEGRNVNLGRLRKALKQNGTGQPWSFAMLGGQVARVKVKHRIDEATQKTYVEVVDVASV